jgi:UMF1 family MFS transporter
MGLVTLLTGNVRNGIVSLVLLFALGFLLLRKVDENQGQREVGAFLQES